MPVTASASPISDAEVERGAERLAEQPAYGHPARRGGVVEDRQCDRLHHQQLQQQGRRDQGHVAEHIRRDREPEVAGIDVRRAEGCRSRCRRGRGTKSTRATTTYAVPATTTPTAVAARFSKNTSRTSVSSQDRHHQGRAGDEERQPRQEHLGGEVEHPEVGEEGAEGDDDADRREIPRERPPRRSSCRTASPELRVLVVGEEARADEEPHALGRLDARTRSPRPGTTSTVRCVCFQYSNCEADIRRRSAVEPVDDQVAEVARRASPIVNSPSG